MQVLRQCFCVMVLGAVIAVTSNIAKAGPQTSSMPIQSPTAITSTRSLSGYNNHLIERQINDKPPIVQVPLTGCPEAFGLPFLACSVCGGESPTESGRCLTGSVDSGFFLCKCDPGVSNPVTTVVVTIINGVTKTVTFELKTLTQYSNLREHITITTMLGTATTTLNSTETTAFVFRGGVFWFPVGGAPIPVIPPTNAPNHDDDTTCKDPKNKCDDCAGMLQMCTTGADISCSCEEKQCPEDGSEDQPNCWDEECDGDWIEAKCRVGELEGCNCKIPECPDVRKTTLWCRECGGIDRNGRCKGEPEDNWFKGCECSPDPDPRLDPPPQRRIYHGRGIDAVMDALPLKPVKPANPKPECDEKNFSDVPSVDFSPNIYTRFCESVVNNISDLASSITGIYDKDGKNRTPQKLDKRIATFSTVSNLTRSFTKRNMDDFAFELKWSREGAVPGVTPCGCLKAFNDLVSSSCGQTSEHHDHMAMEAKLESRPGCGSYSYRIIKDEPLPLDTPTRQDEWACGPFADTKPFSVAWAKSIIATWCKRGDIKVNGPLGQRVTEIYYEPYRGGNRLRMMIRDTIGSKDGCVLKENDSLLITREECAVHFLAAVNKCDMKTEARDGRQWEYIEHGGTYMWSGSKGCIDFDVVAQMGYYGASGFYRDGFPVD